MFIKTKNSRVGMTLVEVLVAMGVASIVMTTILSMSLHTARSVTAMTNYSDLSAQAREAMDRMSRKIRQAEAVTAYTPNSVSLRFEGETLTYTYSEGRRQLIETQGKTQNVLLEDCNTVTFDLFKRAPMSGSFNYFPVLTALNEAKLVQVNWHCSRSLMQSDINSEDILSAKIVMRTL